MISLGSRLPVALAIALLFGLAACAGDDTEDSESTFSTSLGDGDGDPGDGDGDPGDGDGDPNSGDGDGDPTTGDGDGDSSGDGDGDGDGCPGTSMYSGTLEFYNDGSAQGPFDLVGCEPLNAGFQPGSGTVVLFSVLDGQGSLTISIPAGATEGQHELGNGYSALLILNDGLPTGWLGHYDPGSGTMDLVDYFEADGKEITVDLSATLEHTTDAGRFVDIDLSFVATI